MNDEKKHKYLMVQYPCDCLVIVIIKNNCKNIILQIKPI